MILLELIAYWYISKVIVPDDRGGRVVRSRRPDCGLGLFFNIFHSNRLIIQKHTSLCYVVKF